MLALLVVIQTYLLLFSQLSFASPEDSDFLGKNSRWTIDASTRITRNTEKNHNSFQHVIGIDIHKVFSGETSDIGTLLFQPYIVKINNNTNFPFVFDDPNDTQLTWRIANFN